MPHILVIDDDTRLREVLQRYLSEQGFRVTTANEAADARAKLAGIAYDLLVLDIMMPGETGLEMMPWLRKNKRVPVLLLTAMDETEDRIAGLESGADDYLAKPFEPRELVLRINVILRRTQEPVEPVRGEVNFGGFCFDLAREELRKGKRFVRLTAGRSFAAQVARPATGRAGQPRDADLGEPDDRQHARDRRPGHAPAP